jgi:ribosomal protein S18 acetylase RimI-like enzyme
MSQIKIRSAVLSDADEVGALFVELDQHHFAQRPSEFYVLDRPARSQARIAELIQSETGVVLLAEDALTGLILGLADVRSREFKPTTVEPGRSIGEIDSLVVAREHRRRGVGTLLVRGTEHWAKRQGLSALELNVRGFNESAIAFYEASGFGTRSRRMARAVAI